jgi:hypothetical protein
VKTTKYLWLLLVCPLVLSGCGGCRDSKKAKESSDAANETAAAQYRDEMFGYAIDNLDRIEDHNSSDVLVELLRRFDPQNPTKPDSPDHHVDSVTAIWPQPEMFHTSVDRLNQWVREQPTPTDWKVDRVVGSLPKMLAELPQVKNLDKMEFTLFDGFAVQEASWLRDISLWAKGDAEDEVDRVTALFDWTVRNIQLDRDDQPRIPQFPRETILLGHGTALERAWVFILLLRQLDIDAAVLAVEQNPGKGDEGRGAGDGKKEPDASSAVKKPDKAADKGTGKEPGKEPAKNQPKLRPWCVGVLIEGEVYLFDPRLGLPIPAPDGVKLGENGQLVIRPATLSQAIADKKVLQRLDYDESRPYSTKASDLKHVIVLLEASPTSLSKSMKTIESALTGARKLVLTASPSVTAEHWKAAHVKDVRLWFQPFATLFQRTHIDWRNMQFWLPEVMPLFMVYEEHQTTKAKKTSMLPKEMEVEEPERRRGSQVVVNAAPLFKARVLYLKGKFAGDDGAIQYLQMARPSDQSIVMSSTDDVDKQIRVWAKQDASYWFGLLSYQQGNYPAAVDYFFDRTLEAYPNGRWTSGARYNLARSYEADKKSQQATMIYGNSIGTPGFDGDLLRAKWLRELGEQSKSEKP